MHQPETTNEQQESSSLPEDIELDENVHVTQRPGPWKHGDGGPQAEEEA